MIALAAMSLNRVIGKDGKLPWRCPEDLKRFKELTLDKKILVGRTTFEKLPYLPKRDICVLARKPVVSPAMARYKDGELRIISDVDLVPSDAIVCGGAKVYEEFLPHCDTFYLTLIKETVEGDAFMPPFEHLFDKTEVFHETDKFQFLILTK